jgi:hypothetical protein
MYIKKSFTRGACGGLVVGWRAALLFHMWVTAAAVTNIPTVLIAGAPRFGAGSGRQTGEARRTLPRVLSFALSVLPCTVALFSFASFGIELEP